MGLGLQGPICMSTGRDQENPQLARTLNSRIKTFSRQAGETRPRTTVGGLAREAPQVVEGEGRTEGPLVSASRCDGVCAIRRDACGSGFGTLTVRVARFSK